MKLLKSNSLPKAVNKISSFSINNKHIQQYDNNYSYSAVQDYLKHIISDAEKLNFLEAVIRYNYWYKPVILSYNHENMNKSYNNDTLIKLYKDALNISPNKENYLLGLASMYRLSKDFVTATKLWQKVLRINPSNYQALLSLAIYNQFNKNKKAFHKSLVQLDQIDSQRTKKVCGWLRYLDELHTIRLTTNLNRVYDDNSSKHFIVILGAALTAEGKMKLKLKKRLRAGLKLAKRMPNTTILVSGGKLPREPDFEASAMKSWLIAHGIKAKRIITETHSRDTVQNTINSTDILHDKGAKTVTVISNASHMKRSYTLFKTARLITGGKYLLDQYVVFESKDEFKALENNAHDIPKIINDVLRVAGFWLLPGIQR
ncbi:YdcF family protein [Apilactobacillus apisilvae]|uniref:YdcF family protein n=1 Tax=Apilactobacillus apisilvae TaxID=2923364 RepID=A0ABY4PG96_9LACO|nr:YdcF family protein [Apilactobacillus apisilvae]UQS84585.1 YdcF family protein [Apilactobacillus apisilvae]